jgi:glycosyltransferase involved in cell wall biosynthesis
MNSQRKLSEALGQLWETLAAQQRAMEGLEARITHGEHLGQISAVTNYIRQVPVPDGALVSVILATRNRSSLVGTAIRSVLAQTYPRWELLAVDDGSEDDTSAVLNSIGDDRIRSFQISHRGQATARNHALDRAAGDLITYIDDDNTMHPDWLRSVVWAFDNWPDVDLLYGATLIDGPVDPEASVWPRMPWVRFVPSTHASRQRDNPTDIGSMAHRSGLPGCRFDERLNAIGDWDLLLRMSNGHEVVSLPVIAGTYRTDAADRITGSPAWDDDLAVMRRKHGLSLT